MPLWKIYSHRGEDSPGIFARNIYMPCVITGVSFPHQDYSFREYVYAVCNHGGEDSPGICLNGIYIYAACSHGGEFCSPELFLYGTCTRRMYPICDSL